jgi:hypothetical protein
VNDTIAGDVARYATAVRAACADLPGPDRELLLEDLEDHLQEVAAEAGGPLAERLGRPEAYAAELRASAGLPGPGAGTGPAGGPGRPGRRRLRESEAARRLAGLWAAATAHPAWRAVTGFLPELRPAWWVLRGYLAVQALAVAMTFLFTGGGFSFPVPQLLGSSLLGLLAVVAAVAGSVALGRRGARSWGARGLLAAGNAALVVVALLLVAELGNSEAVDDYRPEFAATSAGPVSGLRSDGREITNIFPFDAKGRPLEDVYLVDQDGHPVEATHYGDEYLEPELPLDRDGNEVSNRYPQVQHEVDPFSDRRVPGPTPEFRPPPGPVRSP